MSLIIFENSSVFDSKLQTIVNTVNCVGVMGKGIALEYKKRYPDMFKKYKVICDQKLLDIGKLYLYKSDTHQWVLNFPTKLDWKNPSKEEYLHLGLQKFVETYKQKGITSIAWPLLGASNGGLKMETSLNIMKEYLSHLDIPVEIYLNLTPV